MAHICILISAYSWQASNVLRIHGAWIRVVELHYLADALGIAAPTTYRYDIVASIDAALNSAAAADDARWAAVRRRPGR